VRTRLPVTFWKSGAEFTPAEIPGLALWLDASDATTLFQDAAATTPATATSDPVGYWGDKSGNARHAVQATAGNRPAISGTTQGGRKALAFDAQTKTVISPVSVAQYVADATTSPKMFFAWVARPEGSVTSICWGSPAHPNAASRVFYATDFGGAGSHIVDFGSVSTARLTGTVGDETNNVGHVYSAFRDGAIMSVRRDGVEIIRKTNASGAYTDTTGTLSINTASGGGATASWMEFLAYAASMPAANITRIERYLAAKWGITLAPQVSNADAQDWVNRVYANGGTVSASTAAAVNTFCDAIDSAIIRDRFYRLNLFCGSNLNAALVPLYRSSSFGGSPLGNTTDTNNAFVGVGTDYAETGASGGLTGNGTSKYLNTGLAPSALQSVATGHMAAYVPQITPTDTTRAFLGNASGSHQYNLSYRLNSGNGLAQIRTVWGTTASNDASEPSSVLRGGLRLSTRTSATALRTYLNSTEVSLHETSVTPASHVNNWFVLAFNSAGTPIQYSTDSIRAYSIGESMDAGQVAAYYTAMQAFQTALGRNA
jgi:hypothetical protein